MKNLTFRIVVAFAIGAAIGIAGWLDQQIIGPERYAAIQDLRPVRGFFWLTIGTGCLLVVVYLVGVSLTHLGGVWYRFRLDDRHEHHCMHRERRFRSRYPCTCKLNATQWPPEKVSKALKVIQGGRHD